MRTHATTPYTPHILLVGGGTGGHFYPLIAVAEELNRTYPSKIFYAGPDAYDTGALAKEGIQFMYIPAGKRRKYGSLRNITDSVITFFGFFVALLKLFFHYPDVIFSKGSYTSVPVVLAAAFLRIPIVIHESDTKLGTANTLALRFAHKIFLNHNLENVVKDDTITEIIGIPVRKIFLESAEKRSSVHTKNAIPTILILGGSQGAERINSLILDSLNELLPSYTIIHQTGASNVERCTREAYALITDQQLRSQYQVVGFLNSEELAHAYQIADIVISRAGSNTMYEIALHAIPAIFIPIPEEISHDQRSNAYSYARSGAGIVIEEANATANLLRSEIDRIMQNAEVYEAITVAAHALVRLDVAQHIVLSLSETVQEHVR